MLTVWGKHTGKLCERLQRRDFLRIGAVAGTSLTLSNRLRAQAQAAQSGQSLRDTSVVWLWLGGGPTHIETFDPKMTAPSEYRSVNGAIRTALPGVEIGSLFPEMAKVAEHMAFVRSFAHNNSGHSGGTHWVMTGYNHPPADQGASPIRPSIGSITARVRGANNPASGMPTYVRMSGIYGDGPAWLGTGYGPFDSGGQSRSNMNLSVPLDRLDDRRRLLKDFDRLDRSIDRTGLMRGLDDFEGQAFNLILGSAKEAFDVSREDPRVRERYGTGLGQQLLTARRLCEAGCGFVTLHYGGWDMHGNIAAEMQRRAPEVDRAVGAFVEDIVQRGLDQKILLVITGEFGRTPRVNGSAGRDHWAPLSTLALAGGGLRMGQVIGESSAKAEVPRTEPITPQNLMATVFSVLGIDLNTHFYDHAGRPTPLLIEQKPIAELV